MFTFISVDTDTRFFAKIVGTEVCFAFVRSKFANCVPDWNGSGEGRAAANARDGNMQCHPPQKPFGFPEEYCALAMSLAGALL